MNSCALTLLASVGTDSGTLFDVGGICVCALAEFPSFRIVLLLCRASVGPSPLSKRRAPRRRFHNMMSYRRLST
jgi:hypothetical protein